MVSFSLLSTKAAAERAKTVRRRLDVQSIRTGQYSYKGSCGGSIAVSIASCPNHDGDSLFEGSLPAEQGGSHDRSV